MNIFQARQIPLQCLVERLGGTFSHKGTGSELWYRSPFRPDEKTASFKIDEKTNKWHDFARSNKIDAHGDILDLWADYNNRPRRDGEAVRQALKFLSQAFGENMPDVNRNNHAPRQVPQIAKKEPRYRLIKQPGKIWLDSLKAEVGRRGLSLGLVQPYLKQAFIEDIKTGRQYNGFAFKNDKGGHEISLPNPYKNESFKTVIGPKAITSIINTEQRDACVFEGFWDCMTYLAMNRDAPVIPTLYVLNSTSMVHELADRLIRARNSTGKVFLFLDNDEAGLKAQTLLLDLLQPHELVIGTMNHLYKGYKDVSEWWVEKQRSNTSNSKNSLRPAQHLQFK